MSRTPQRPGEGGSGRGGRDVGQPPLRDWIAQLRERVTAVGGVPLEPEEQQALGALIVTLSELLGESDDEQVPARRARHG